MKLSLLPKERIFYDLLEKLAGKAEQGILLFKSLINSWDGQHFEIKELKELEHECDGIVQEIMLRLNKTFITPIDREDIHLLTNELDDLVDIIQTLSKRIDLFQIKEINEELKKMTVVLEKSLVIVVGLIKKMRSLKDSQAILEMCRQIHLLESEGDRIYEAALAGLFQGGFSAIEVIKWKEIYDFMELAIDKCEDISDVLWGIVVKYG